MSTLRNDGINRSVVHSHDPTVRRVEIVHASKFIKQEPLADFWSAQISNQSHLHGLGETKTRMETVQNRGITYTKHAPLLHFPQAVIVSLQGRYSGGIENITINQTLIALPTPDGICLSLPWSYLLGIDSERTVPRQEAVSTKTKETAKDNATGGGPNDAIRCASCTPTQTMMAIDDRNTVGDSTTHN